MGDYGPKDGYGRIRERSYKRGGYDRERRLQTTIAVGAVVLLLLGLGIGFALGRATAPKTVASTTPADSGIITDTTTMPVDAAEEISETVSGEDTDVAIETSESVETTADTAPPSKPKQLAPYDGAVLTGARVTLRWSKSTDDTDEPIKYAFEIQNRRSDGTYGNTQVITGLTSRSYQARVLPGVRRRWRVWAVDAAGNASGKSGWRYYRGKVVAPSSSNDSSSTATSGTAN